MGHTASFGFPAPTAASSSSSNGSNGLYASHSAVNLRSASLRLEASKHSRSPSIGYAYDGRKNFRPLSWMESCCLSFNALAPMFRILIIIGIILIFFISLTISILFITDRTLSIIVVCILISLSSLVFSCWLLSWIMRFDEGPSDMKEIADAIKEGSEGFFAIQYSSIAKISLVFAAILFVAYAYRPTSALPMELAEIGSWRLAGMTAVTFLLGAGCSALSGYSGMWVSVRTNVRVASAARRCYNEALQLCFRGGAFSSVINVGLAVGGVASMVCILRWLYPQVPLNDLPLLMIGYGFGASLVAMFAQLGGGIFTKAADVGADLVGKVESGIPEDDQRNPAVIADLVGDNVGDCAGQCADLFESIAAEILSAMILGGALAHEAALPTPVATGFVLFPLGVHCIDLIISSIGVLFVSTTKGNSPDLVASDPLRVMITVYLWTCAAALCCFAGLCRVLLFVESHPFAWLYFFGCGIVGMLTAFLFVLFTQMYTDYQYSKVRSIAEASQTGPATNIIAGLAVGMESTALPVIVLVGAICSSYYLGLSADLVPPQHAAVSGLFGTAVATMGMLSTAVFVLSMSSFGPIADNAGGIVELSLQSHSVRAITDRLDAVGNVTKANTKGFSVGSASLACFLLFSAFLDEASLFSKVPITSVDLTIPEVFASGLLGAMLVYLFSSWAMDAVGTTAQEVVKEVRRQFRECPGILDYTERPDYHTCVSISSRAALKKMVKPGLLAVCSPLVVGFVFRFISKFRSEPNLAAKAVASFLMFSTATGILMALFLNNSGGAWDNAKKYIETGALGGKGSDTHKASVVGDTVGDPCKDTAGPSVHVLIKLVATVTMVLSPLFVD